MKRLLAILVCGAALATLTGCASLEKQLFKVWPAVVTTNSVTNSVTGEVISQVVSNPPVVTVNPVVTTTLQAAGTLPVPWLGFASTILLSILASYAAHRNKTLAKALVMGIDDARIQLQASPEGRALDGVIKDALIAHQEAAGVLNAASRLVNAYTGNTVR